MLNSPDDPESTFCQTDRVPTEPRAIRSWSDIPGFFRWVDRWVFATLLKAQENFPPGHLVELGTYQAKSAVIIGEFLRPDERFVAVDLFGREDLLDSSRSGVMNRDENRRQYANLDRQQFERNYLALHQSLPQIHEGLSTDIVDLVEPHSARFVHVDAGHMYDQVRQDVMNAKTISQPGGIVAFDDYRTEHTPGVSAAVWQAVFFDGFIPVALTPQKMYGVYDGTDPAPYQDALKAFVASDRQKWWMQEQYVLGRPLLRVKNKEQPKPAVPPKKAKKSQPAPPQPAPEPTALSKIARYVAPPVLVRWARARRNSK